MPAGMLDTTVICCSILLLFYRVVNFHFRCYFFALFSQFLNAVTFVYSLLVSFSHLTAKVADGDVAEMSPFQRAWSQASRRQSSFEHVARLIEELFQPDRPAVTSQRVRTQTQMKQNFEQLLQPRVESFQLVAVQPEISQREIEPDDRFRTDSAQRAIVQVESGGRQTHERFGVDANVSVPVDEEMLKRQAVKRARFNRPDPVVTEIQPAQMGEVPERADLDVLEPALAEVQVLQDEVGGHVGTCHGGRGEQVAVEVQLKRVGGHAVRDGGQSTPRAVDDVTRRVTEAGTRTPRCTGLRSIFDVAFDASPFSRRLTHLR